MELLPADAKTLREMVANEWFPHEERELEATFGANGVVDSTRFLAVAQRLKSKGFKEVREPDRLTISLEDNTRYTIESEGTIAQYCEDNKIAGKSAVAMIKDRAGNLHTLDLNEYDTRIKIRRELPLDMNDPRVKSHLATWDQRVKFFRLIQRWKFIGNGVIFDLSMVRSTKKDDRGLWKRVTKFYDEYLQHNIMKEMPSYEIEVELDRSSEYANEPTKALNALVQGIGEVLRGIQRNPILIRNSVKQKVLEGYNNLVGASDEPGKKGFRGVQPVTLERANMGKRTYYTKNIPSIQDDYNVTDKADGLRVMGYCDDNGELFMLDMGLNVYRTGLKKQICRNTLVDGEWITVNKKGEPVQMLMLFDIYHAIGGSIAYILPFYTFSSSVGISTRHKLLKEWCDRWRQGGGPISLVKGLTPQNSLKVMEKTFEFAQGGEIFDKCKSILDREVPYNTDGLILTANAAAIPDRFGVRFAKQFKWKPAHDNTIDFLVKFVKDPQTGQDKLTDIIRPDSQDTIKYKTLRLYIGTSADPAYDDPRRTILLNKKLPSGRPGGKGAKRYRMRPVLFSPKNYEDSMASICYLEAKEDVATRDYIVRCTSKDDEPGEATGDPITNNSIVEMRYDPNPSLPGGWNWVPMRVRYDKTERFQSGTIEKTLNSVETAESVWNSIHDPVTRYMITTGSDMPSKQEQQQFRIQQEQSGTVSKRYYQKKSTIKNVSLVRSMTGFHNQEIKGMILTAGILQNSNIGLPEKKTVLDTSIGKGGDIKRYITDVKFLLGIDIDADGIRDPDEGAYRRYLDRLVEDKANTMPVVPPMLFLIGDSSKSYMDGSAAPNEEEADMMRAVIGKVNPVSKLPPYVETKCKGALANGADLMSSMFSIHYYFESKEKWEGFLHNIRDNLKVGGFFVCCCFDGNIVANTLSDLEKGESIEGTDEVSGAMIWKITKENTLSNLPSTPEEGFGHAIDVDFLSIGSSHREYLVSPELLIQQMNSIGCDLLYGRDRQAMGYNTSTETFQETYENPYATHSSVYPMTDAVKRFSFLNRWYIFRRYGTAPVQRPETPVAAPGTPVYSSESPAYGSATPTYNTAAAYATASPAYAPGSPVYAATSPAYTPATPPAMQQQSNLPRAPALLPGYTARWDAYDKEWTVVETATGKWMPYDPSGPYVDKSTGVTSLPPGWTTEIDTSKGYNRTIYVQTSTGNKWLEPPELPLSTNPDVTYEWNPDGNIQELIKKQKTASYAYRLFKTPTFLDIPSSPPYRPTSPPVPPPPGWTAIYDDSFGDFLFKQEKSGLVLNEYPMLPFADDQDDTMYDWSNEGDILVLDRKSGKLQKTTPYKDYYTTWGGRSGQSQEQEETIEAAAALSQRPTSPAWRNVPLSGNTEQSSMLAIGAGAGQLRIAIPTAAAAATTNEEESPLPSSPAYRPDSANQAEEIRKWEEKKARLEAKAKAKSGLVTAVVEGGARTVAVERGPAAGPQRKYKPNEVLRFFGRAELKDSLGINDAGAARWLALSAPFPIKDGGLEYPTVNHYLAAMKYKLATDKPDLGADLFSTKGTIHAKYIRQREQIATRHKAEEDKPQLKESEDQELLRQEAADVAEAALPKMIKRYKARFDEAKWIAEKDDVLKKALSQRWKHDARFRKIVEAAKEKGKYLLYYTGSSTVSSYGGIRRDDGHIEGENQVGKIIMELAGYPSA